MILQMTTGAAANLPHPETIAAAGSCTDRGSECNAAKTEAACRALGITQSMGSVGCALYNAAEAFDSTLKVEFAHLQHQS